MTAAPSDSTMTAPARNIETEGAYVGRKPCGCLTMMVLDGCRDAAKEVAKAIRAGDTVDHMTVEAARQVPWNCAAHPRQPKKAKARKQGALL